ncbi:MAG: Hsp20/alpha crystallin family protein [Acidaminococcaceae bacterium]|nr:Hsp20/alpha crystallin family protein [Acidaminococcaceae bacterium]
MMLPSIFGENLFDDWMNDSGLMNPSAFFGKTHSPLYGKHASNIMKTDIRENKESYDVIVDLPGFKKEGIQVQLEDGYLTITAAKSLNKDEKNEEGKYIRQERYTGSCTRSFYVGTAITEEDIKAKFEDGTLRLNIPKKDPKAVEGKKYIAIEG